MAKEIRLDAIAALTPYEVIRTSSGVITMGREPENGIVIDSDLVSRRHSGIYAVGSQWIYRDLGSTNGSWVNGLEVKSGHPYLLRDGDVVRVADFPLQLNEIDESSVDGSPSLIILLSDKFDQELPLEDGVSLTIGGADASIVIDEDERRELGRIMYQNSRVSLDCLVIENPKKTIYVNGITAQGSLDLDDRDVVSVGHYVFIVNLPSSNTREEGRRYAERVRKESSEELASVGVYDSKNLPEHLKKKKQDDGWESQPARRRSASGKMFVFGSDPGGESFNETQTLSNSDIRSKLGYEMSPSQRFRGSFGDPLAEEKKSKKVTKILSLIGALIFFCALAALIYFLVK